MNKPTAKAALSIIDQATQPGVALKRADYVLTQLALEVLAEVVDRLEKLEAPQPEAPATPKP